MRHRPYIVAQLYWVPHGILRVFIKELYYNYTNYKNDYTNYKIIKL
jgi:hypothetical protein